MSVAVVIYLLVILLALIEEFRSQGQSFVGWAVVILAGWLLVQAY